MAEFEFLAFDKANGDILGYGATVKATKDFALKRAATIFRRDPANDAKVLPDPDIIFLRAGDSAPYIWAEKLSYGRAQALLASLSQKNEHA